MPFSRPSRGRLPIVGLPLAAALWLAAAQPAAALSQITGEDGSAPARDGIVAVPLPPVEGGPAGEAPQPPAAPPGGPAAPAGPPGLPPADAPSPAAPTGPAAPGAPAAPSASEDPAAADEGAHAPAPPAEIRYGEEGLPTPVRDLRRKLIEIARTGEVDRLRDVLETGAEPTVLSATGSEGDPIATLKESSGDGEGVEMLAILLETLEAGHVRLGGDGDNEIFVWPYFTQVNLETLTRPQLVELFELVTAGDYQRMVANGSYDFFRVGISPEGRFEFFVAGD